MRRPFIASISGKGGVGKTILTALLLKVLLEKKTGEPVLVIDADPATNLPDVLGIQVRKTIGDVVEEFRRKAGDIDMLGYEKSSLLQYWIIRDCLLEFDGFDFLAMGRGEGEGCYCLINMFLTRILTEFIKNYTVVLMDMEAGLEHLSRRVDRYVNTLIVVVDPSVMSLKTAERIITVAREVNIKPDKFYLVGNRIPESLINNIAEYAKKIGFEYAGTIPFDENIRKHSIENIPLLNLSSASPALQAVRAIAKNIGLTD